jgi:hypothetical protein
MTFGRAAFVTANAVLALITGALSLFLICGFTMEQSEERWVIFGLGAFAFGWIAMVALRKVRMILSPSSLREHSKWLRMSTRTMKTSAGLIVLLFCTGVYVGRAIGPYFWWLLRALVVTFAAGSVSAIAAGISDFRSGREALAPSHDGHDAT